MALEEWEDWELGFLGVGGRAYGGSGLEISQGGLSCGLWSAWDLQSSWKERLPVLARVGVRVRSRGRGGGGLVCRVAETSPSCGQESS